MIKDNFTEKKIMISILSLSLLTVMAGAAVAPALDIIREHFRGTDQMLVQMIISVPALFIVITSLIFPALCSRFRSRTLLKAGLLMYIAGGCSAGAFSNIFLVLAARAFVGIAVGILMPLSTGLLAFYFARDRQEKLMGYSSAMNQMGGAAATLMSGFLAGISWRASFLVYLAGLISLVPCLMFMPDDSIRTEEARKTKGVLKDNMFFVVSMFVLMFTFFIYPADFAMETVKDGIISQHWITIIMTMMDLVALLGGLAFVHIKNTIGETTRLAAPLLFLAGYLTLEFAGGWAGTIVGSCLVGFANGAGIPYIISSASRKAGKAAATTVMPLISAALYLAQFTTPMILSAVRKAFGNTGIDHLSYCTAIAASLLLLGISLFWRGREKEG